LFCTREHRGDNFSPRMPCQWYVRGGGEGKGRILIGQSVPPTPFGMAFWRLKLSPLYNSAPRQIPIWNPARSKALLNSNLESGKEPHVLRMAPWVSRYQHWAFHIGSENWFSIQYVNKHTPHRTDLSNDIKNHMYKSHETIPLSKKHNNYCATMPIKMMWLVEISRQEDNAVIRDLFPLVHRGYWQQCSTADPSVVAVVVLCCWKIRRELIEI
jgi:hypothetical protein